MNLCKFGCGNIATHIFKDGTFCCNKIWQRCPVHKNNIGEHFKNKPSPLKGTIRDEKIVKKSSDSLKKYWNIESNRIKQSDRLKLSCKKEEVKKNKSIAAKKQWKDPVIRKRMNESRNRYWNNLSFEEKKKFALKKQRTIEYIKEKYPTFFKVEDLRYNPDKPGEKEIQVRCKNHLCKNSKEKGGWFTATGRQLEWRIYAIESNIGNDGGYFYCSDKCKSECPLYNLRSDPNEIKDLLYTQSEYQIFRQEVLHRANNFCEYCHKHANHVHHSRPQKLEPGFTLDPDFGIACCKECHYKYGHKDECSTGQLSNIICK